jgi:sugar/nucleoside kinase (ribokinase family)
LAIFRNQSRPEAGFPHGLPTGERSPGGTIGNVLLSLKKKNPTGTFELATQRSHHPGYAGYLDALMKAGIVIHPTDHDKKPPHGLILPTETTVGDESIRDRAILSANGGLPRIEVPSDMILRADRVVIANMGGDDWEKTLNNISGEIDGRKPKIFIGGSQISKALAEKTVLAKIGKLSPKVEAIKRFVNGASSFMNETEAADMVRIYEKEPEPTAEGLVRQFQRLTGVLFGDITFGAKGAYLIDPEQTVHHHTAPIETGLDPAGMGDEHGGATAHGLIIGETIESALVNARNAAVKVGRHPSAQRNQMTQEEWIPNTTAADHEGHAYRTYEPTDRSCTHIEVSAVVPDADRIVFERRAQTS